MEVTALGSVPLEATGEATAPVMLEAMGVSGTVPLEATGEVTALVIWEWEATEADHLGAASLLHLIAQCNGLKINSCHSDHYHYLNRAC